MIETLADRMSPSRVGWKFARLKVLHDAGLRVPPLFCLTGEFFEASVRPVRSAIDQVLRGIDFTDWRQLQASADRIRSIVRSVELDHAAQTALDAALDTTFDADTLLAVRASVLTGRLADAEDSADHPFAGLSDSFLYVPRDGVLEAVRNCWASGFNPEGLLYRHRQALSVDRLAVAVGVQRMVPGERSLVMFTCDPASHAHNTVISASWGIGEGVVQDKADADHYFLHARTGEVETAVATKTEMVTLDSRSGHGTRVVPVPDERRTAPVLTEEEIRAIAAVGRQIEQIFGGPQDVESTITPDGDLHVLQTRPIAIAKDRHRVWSSANVSESFPGTTTPMTYSVARRFYWLLNHDYLRRCGVPERTLHELHDTMTRLLGFIDYRIYHNIASFIKMLSVLPIFEGYQRDWERLVAELDTFYHHAATRPNTRRARLGRRAALVRGWLRAARNYAHLGRDFAAFQAEWAAVMREQTGVHLAQTHPLSLVTAYRDTWDRAGRLWGITLINYQFMVFAHKAIEQCLSRWKIDDDGTLFGRLLCGGDQLRGAEIALSAVRLAEMVRADPEVAELFARKEPREIWSQLDQGDLPADLTTAVRVHLDKFGERGLQELKLERPSLRDTPWELVKIVQQYAASELTAAALDDIETASRRAGEELLRERLAGHPIRRRVLLALFDRLRTFLYYREAGRYSRSELFGYSKRVIATVGAQLCQRGFLRQADDVFFLDIDELFGFVDGTGSTADLAGLVEVRRGDRHRAEQSMPAREFVTADIVGAGVPRMERQIREGERVLTGLGSCPGTVRGYARVIHDPSLGEDLDADSILVARETDPGWLYLMLAARGIVVERGSLLSHTAITGRKFGIPTVVGVNDATRTITDGSLIEIDGGSGRVVVLETQQ